MTYSSEGRTSLVGIGATEDDLPPRPLTILSIDGSSSTVNVRSSSSNILEDGQITRGSSRYIPPSIIHNYHFNSF